MAYLYLDGELIDLPDVVELGSVESGGLVPLLKRGGEVIGMASIAGGGFSLATLDGALTVVLGDSQRFLHFWAI